MTDKIAVVTGASRGLGAALAEALTPDYHVIAVARTTGALEELDDKIKARGGEATLAPMDITDAGAMAHLCRSIHDRWGHVDHWFHTAINSTTLMPMGHITDKDMEKVLGVNITATQRLMAFMEPLLQAANDGTAHFFDDNHAGQKFFGSYGASKAAQMALVSSWMKETTKLGPRVILHTPSEMPTGFRARFHPGQKQDTLSTPSAEAAKIIATL
ncbi:MAG: SDR family NAD(P)-dependent oxidoreductase [Halocynthiibacter sp.]